MAITDRQSLLDILRVSSKSLSTREISARIRSVRKQVPDYIVGMQLRSMIGDGLVELCDGRWNKVKSQVDDPSKLRHLPHKLLTPCLSPETRNLLGSIGRRFTSEIDNPVEWEETTRDATGTDVLTNKWATFRQLLSYYRQCIRNEEGADASAFQNQLGDKFLYLYKTGNWFPHPKVPWQTSIPVGPHANGFLSSLPAPSTEESLVLGYPVYAYYDKRDGEPDISIIRPIFYFSIEHYLSGGTLMVKSGSPRVEINLGWLDYSFKKNPGKKNAFLSACGFINRPRPVDEAPGLEGSEPSPTMEMLVKVLESFMPHRICGLLDIHFISGEKLGEPFNSGIYNKAVVMLAKRTKYTATLLKELKAIESAPDHELDKTALASIFTKRNDTDLKLKTSEINHEEIVLDTAKLNAEQRHAVASLLNYPVTVITGPPGTGKSQVVSSAAVNARIKEQTVLFASRNHKAIDTVMDRMISVNGKPLMVRTNSKDDPNLNFTFEKAIKILLAEHQDSVSTNQLMQTKEEIATLLEERGTAGRYARQAAKYGEDLGQLEDRLAYLRRLLPTALAAYLDAKPDMFPTKAVLRLDTIIDSMLLEYTEGKSLTERLQNLCYLLVIIPCYFHTKRRFHPIPGTPKLATIPTVTGLKHLKPELSTIKRAAEFANDRIDCQPIEEKIRELPPLAELTAEITELTERLVELVPKAIEQDSISRQGLPAETDREELDGLRAAIRSLRTGLADGKMQMDTIVTIKKNLPALLKRFPCWSATNLSVGSHIPLISGMFDLAIIDEASQSDIPSAIPILFRAKRAGVVGDPYQLNHISKLTTAKDTMIRQQANIVEIRDLRFSYTENSIFDIFRGTNNVEPIFLSETYRSASAIAGYSNQVFYNGRLRVATDHSKLKVPSGMKAGIHWTDVQGEVKNAGGSGCFCQDEISEINNLLRTMLLKNNFLGSIGIVTPFRQQANRLRDTLFESDAEFYHALDRSGCHVDTAHGFQGDERDVIIFSLCGGPEMPGGSRSFLESTGNLFNVAISRARAVVHVVGNREWAARCGIKHVEQLAKPAGAYSSGTPKRSEWYPHESPWEKIFFDALLSAGLDPRPQLPVAGRRLDMALVRDDRSLKIDIEVDGDCHRNPDGSRKQDDVWRDMELQSLGWKVMRFWTYQLRENIHQCTDKVLNTWRQHE